MIKRVLLGVAVISVLVSSGIAFGVWITNERAKYWSIPSQLERRAKTVLRSAFASSNEATTSSISTNRLRLNKSVFNLPFSVAFQGGGIAEAPGGGILLVDRTGKVFFHTDGQTTELGIDTPDNGLDDLSRRIDAGEFGDGEFRPKSFRFNDILAVRGSDSVELFVSFSDWEPERSCYRNVLSQVTLPASADIEEWTVERDDWRELKVTEPCLLPLQEFGWTVLGVEAGGRLVAVSENEIVWSTGGYGWDDFFKESGIEPYAQRDDSDYGRLLKINVTSGESMVLARGLRNPQGLTAASDGRIFVTDHGMRGGDEVNLVEPNRVEYNFGWPYVTYGTHYNRKPAHVSGRHAGHDGYDLPQYAFVPSIAPGAAVFVENFHPSWDGDVLVGGLKRTFERVHQADDRVMFVEQIDSGERTRDMQLTSDGQIVVWNDYRQLIFLSPSTQPTPVDLLLASLDDVENEQVRQNATRLANACLVCHSLEPRESMAGPSLHGVCGQRFGGADGYDAYSEALASSRSVWTEQLLAQFIMNAQDIVPGTTMAWEGTPDREAATVLAGRLCVNGGSN